MIPLLLKHFGERSSIKVSIILQCLKVQWCHYLNFWIFLIFKAIVSLLYFLMVMMAACILNSSSSVSFTLFSLHWQENWDANVLYQLSMNTADWIIVMSFCFVTFGLFLLVCCYCCLELRSTVGHNRDTRMHSMRAKLQELGQLYSKRERFFPVGELCSLYVNSHTLVMVP